MTQSRCVLVVDDNIDHLLATKWILERRGFEVLTLPNSEELIERIQIFQPALINMDHDMPGMTGLEAIQLIKNDQLCKDIPVVYFSAESDIETLAARPGADDWLCKPFLLQDLVSKTKKYLTWVMV